MKASVHDEASHKTSQIVPNRTGLPAKQGLYDPRFEHDACGVGFVVDIKGRASQSIVADALTVLNNLDHRSACGAEVNTGDGAGILIQLPHKFLVKVTQAQGFTLPEPGAYGVGMLYFSQDEEARRRCEAMLEQIVAEEGQTLLGWRTVPTNGLGLGKAAQSRQPFVRQLFIGRNEAALPKTDALAFERKLCVIRKRAENTVLQAQVAGENDCGDLFYFASFSSRTIVYKGMLRCAQVVEFYPDLLDTEIESAIALVHSRFSTNTFPSW